MPQVQVGILQGEGRESGVRWAKYKEHIGFYRDNIGIMEKKMETTV